MVQANTVLWHGEGGGTNFTSMLYNEEGYVQRKGCREKV